MATESKNERLWKRLRAALQVSPHLIRHVRRLEILGLSTPTLAAICNFQFTHLDGASFRLVLNPSSCTLYMQRLFGWPTLRRVLPFALAGLRFLSMPPDATALHQYSPNSLCAIPGQQSRLSESILLSASASCRSFPNRTLLRMSDPVSGQWQVSDFGFWTSVRSTLATRICKVIIDNRGQWAPLAQSMPNARSPNVAPCYNYRARDGLSPNMRVSSPTFLNQAPKPRFAVRTPSGTLRACNNDLSPFSMQASCRMAARSKMPDQFMVSAPMAVLLPGGTPITGGTR
ncbi:hypothetical protein C8R44DRAFT_894713 [Mycena epipterygia]|nr:hypothetical protein C8R44DRAFT_894713 [Mycena epipterygia]